MVRLVLVLCLIALVSCGGPQAEQQRATPQPASHEDESSERGGKVVVEKIERSEEEWRRLLTPEEYRILREKGTEAPGTGKYEKTKTKGVYKCAGCDLPLFESDTKFDSGCGWPSFFRPLEGAHITETHDTSLGLVRTEVTCTRCGGHLGHVFNDGPAPTGLRYCINSASVDLEPETEK